MSVDFVEYSCLIIKLDGINMFVLYWFYLFLVKIDAHTTVFLKKKKVKQSIYYLNQFTKLCNFVQISILFFITASTPDKKKTITQFK